jgi:hypothetical protein
MLLFFEHGFFLIELFYCNQPIKKKYFICRIRHNKNKMSAIDADVQPEPPLSLFAPPVPQNRFATLSDETLKERDVRLFRKYLGESYEFQSWTKFLQRSTLIYVMRRVNLTRNVPLLTPGTALIDY